MLTSLSCLFLPLLLLVSLDKLDFFTSFIDALSDSFVDLFDGGIVIDCLI